MKQFTECILLRSLLFLVLLLAASCGEKSQPVSDFHDPSFVVESPEFYGDKLFDATYKWRGPTSTEDRIPKLHAARALAYLGDKGVPVLLDAIKDKRIDVISIYDGLAEIGLPVHKFESEIIQKRDDSAIREWWIKNKDNTREERSNKRQKIGLPKL